MRKEDILAQCLDDIEAGKATVEECMAKYPELRDELQPLLETVQRLQAPHVAPSAEFRHRAKRRLLEAMQESPAHAGRGGVAIPGWLKALVVVKRPSFAVTAALITLLLAAGGGSAAYASQDSLPGDALYPVKKGVEDVHLAITRSPEARVGLRATLAQRRVEEIIAQANLGRSVSGTAVAAIPGYVDAVIAQVSSAPPEQVKPLLSQLVRSTLRQEIRLSQALATAPEGSYPKLKQAFDVVQRGNLIALVSYDNPAFLSSRPSVKDNQLEAAYFEVKGTLISDDSGNWNVGGVVIKDVKLESAPERPVVGRQVQIRGVVQKDGTFISMIDSHEGTEGQVEVQGVLGGTSPDQKVWYVGGVPVTKPQNATPPPVGSSMQVAGSFENDKLVVTSVSSETDEDNVKISGTLAGVNASQNNIAVDMAGSKVTFDASKASIESRDGKPLTLSDLNTLVGKDVRVSKPYEVDGVLHAQRVSVDVNQATKPTETDKGQRSDSGDDRRGSYVSPAPTPNAASTSAPTPTPTPSPTLRNVERTGDGAGQEQAEGREGQASYTPRATPTPVPVPTPVPTPALLPTATPEHTEKEGDGSDVTRSGSDLKPTPTLVPMLTPVPTPTLRPSPTLGHAETGDKEGSYVEPTPTPVPTPTLRPSPTAGHTETVDREDSYVSSTPTPVPTPTLRPPTTPTP